MFGISASGLGKAKRTDYVAQATAVSRSHALIEFDVDGTIVWANANYLNLMGYTSDELIGRHHRTLVDPD